LVGSTNKIKNDRETARKKAELSKDPTYVQACREKAALLKREIVASKN
jgi:hypothetical protein